MSVAPSKTLLKKKPTYDEDKHPVMFRGRPIDMNAKVTSRTTNPSTPVIRLDRENVFKSALSSQKKAVTYLSL